MIRKSDRGVSVDGVDRDFVFVFEQALSHVVHGNNLERAVAREADIAASVIRVEHRDDRLTSGVPGLRSWSFEASWGTRKALRESLNGRRPDALFIHTQVASLLSVGFMRDVPTVISMDATPINYDSVGESYGHTRQAAWLEWGKRYVNRRAFVAARAIVTWSEWAADSVVRDYGIPDDKVHVIRPGVDLERFRPGPKSRSSEPVRILFVGSDFARKGGDDLLEAMRQFGPAAELDIITTTSPSEIPSGVTARVHVGLGHDSGELFDLYRRADIFALPTRGDCSPHVIAEALGSGLPVIVSDVGAVSEMVIEGQNGLLVTPGAPRQLAEALKFLVERPGARRGMGEEARRIAEREQDGGRNAQAIFELMRRCSRTGGPTTAPRVKKERILPTKVRLPADDGDLTHPRRRDFVFVLEQVLGHGVHGTNLERTVAQECDISATVIHVKHDDDRVASRLPGLGTWSFEASWATRQALRDHLDNSHADALFIHTQVSALLVARVMRSVPTVVSMDATPMNYDRVGASYGHTRQGPALEWVKRRVNRHALTAAAAIVTWSRWAADSVVEDYGIVEHRVHVIRPGVDLRQFCPKPLSRQPGPARILFVGGDFYRKGGKDLLEAMRHLVDVAELDIVTTSLPAAIAPDLPIRVHLGVDHHSKELYELYQRADMFVLPSRSECYGQVIGEALACGLPVVACNVGAVPEMVVDGHNGMLIPAGDVGDLVRALRQLAASPDLRQAMGARGLRMAQQEHDADRNAGAVFELMRQLSDAGSSAMSSGSRVPGRQAGAATSPDDRPDD